jgi:hypothetical protein
MRNLAAIFLLLIFTFQMLPVKAIGKLMAKGTQTEEVEDDGCDDLGVSEKCDEVYLYCSYYEVVFLANPTVSTVFFDYNQNLTDAHIRDIHSPPPNLTASYC